MRISKRSCWNEEGMEKFLQETFYPLRLSFLNQDKTPQICSLWYEYMDGAFLCASHKNTFLVAQLKRNSQVSFEISSNDYPYKGVRGKGDAFLSMQGADVCLGRLVSRYLKGGNSDLSEWLLSRSHDEYVIKIVPTLIGAWDFSNRMES